MTLSDLGSLGEFVGSVMPFGYGLLYQIVDIGRDA